MRVREAAAGVAQHGRPRSVPLEQHFLDKMNSTWRILTLRVQSRKPAEKDAVCCMLCPRQLDRVWSSRRKSGTDLERYMAPSCKMRQYTPCSVRNEIDPSNSIYSISKFQSLQRHCLADIVPSLFFYFVRHGSRASEGAASSLESIRHQQLSIP